MSPTKTVEDVARFLAREHQNDDSNIREIYWSPHATEVRLIEVNSSISDRKEILPFRFSPDFPDVPYASVVILLSPDDWTNRSSLPWPNDIDTTAFKKVV
jgi:hypothetical protein